LKLLFFALSAKNNKLRSLGVSSEVPAGQDERAVRYSSNIQSDILSSTQVSIDLRKLIKQDIS